MALSGDLLRGHTDTIILRILLNGDSYGYAISAKIDEQSGGMADVKEATIYLAFRRMEQDGLITTYWGDGTGGARRRYYCITDKGKIELDRRTEEWIQAQQIINKLIIGG